MAKKGKLTVNATGPLSEMAARLASEAGSEILSQDVDFGEWNVYVAAENLLKVLRFLRDDNQLQFINIIDICGVDYPGDEQRFEVVYHLLSPRQNQRVRLKVRTAEGVAIPSATPVFPGADWFEREAYDMYGILFSAHPDLRRILTDYGFDGHPLRKDFPLTGYVEVRYDDEAKRVVYEPVELRQEFRDFDFESPWEGTDYILPGDEKASS